MVTIIYIDTNRYTYSAFSCGRTFCHLMSRHQNRNTSEQKRAWTITVRWNLNSGKIIYHVHTYGCAICFVMEQMKYALLWNKWNMLCYGTHEICFVMEQMKYALLWNKWNMLCYGTNEIYFVMEQMKYTLLWKKKKCHP